MTKKNLEVCMLAKPLGRPPGGLLGKKDGFARRKFLKNPWGKHVPRYCFVDVT